MIVRCLLCGVTIGETQTTWVGPRLCDDDCASRRHTQRSPGTGEQVRTNTLTQERRSSP